MTNAFPREKEKETQIMNETNKTKKLALAGVLTALAITTSLIMNFLLESFIID